MHVFFDFFEELVKVYMLHTSLINVRLEHVSLDSAGLLHMSLKFSQLHIHLCIIQASLHVAT